MKAKKINENLEFERGGDPKGSLKIGREALKEKILKETDWPISPGWGTYFKDIDAEIYRNNPIKVIYYTDRKSRSDILRSYRGVSTKETTALYDTEKEALESIKNQVDRRINAGDMFESLNFERGWDDMHKNIGVGLGKEEIRHRNNIEVAKEIINHPKEIGEYYDSPYIFKIANKVINGYTIDGAIFDLAEDLKWFEMEPSSKYKRKHIDLMNILSNDLGFELNDESNEILDDPDKFIYESMDFIRERDPKKAIKIGMDWIDWDVDIYNDDHYEFISIEKFIPNWKGYPILIVKAKDKSDTRSYSNIGYYAVSTGGLGRTHFNIYGSHRVERNIKNMIRRRGIKESFNFERGMDPKVSLDVGMFNYEWDRMYPGSQVLEYNKAIKRLKDPSLIDSIIWKLDNRQPEWTVFYQVNVLNYLIDHGGEAPYADIKPERAIPAKTMSRIFKKWEANGTIVRAKQGRNVIILLAKGKYKYSLSESYNFERGKNSYDSIDIGNKVAIREKNKQLAKKLLDTKEDNLIPEKAETILWWITQGDDASECTHDWFQLAGFFDEKYSTEEQLKNRLNIYRNFIGKMIDWGFILNDEMIEEYNEYQRSISKALKVYESLDFERGLDPKKSMGIGKLAQIEQLDKIIDWDWEFEPEYREKGDMDTKPDEIIDIINFHGVPVKIVRAGNQYYTVNALGEPYNDDPPLYSTPEEAWEAEKDHLSDYHYEDAVWELEEKGNLDPSNKELEKKMIDLLERPWEYNIPGSIKESIDFKREGTPFEKLDIGKASRDKKIIDFLKYIANDEQFDKSSDSFCGFVNVWEDLFDDESKEIFKYFVDNWTEYQDEMDELGIWLEEEPDYDETIFVEKKF